MPQNMDPQSYKSMIEALKAFAINTEKSTDQLRAACVTCATELGEKDVSSRNLARESAQIAQKYAGLATEARRIAREMEQELEDYYGKARRQWENDDDY